MSHAKTRHWPWVVMPIAGLVVGLGLGSIGNGSDTPAPQVVTSDPENTNSPKASNEPTNPEITDGVWLVGEEIRPGTYRTVELVTDDCYWEIARIDGEILDNDIPVGGRPTVELHTGWQFTTHDCGDWIRSDG